jgi:hypothetical protein
MIPGGVGTAVREWIGPIGRSELYQRMAGGFHMTNEERQKIKERLEQIAAANGGRLEVDHVIADAKQPSSPLHGQFEWNVKKAAMEHWRDTARQLISSVRVIVTTEEHVINSIAYVRDPTAEHDQQGYVATKQLRNDHDLARAAVINEYSRAAAALRRAREVAAVLGIQPETDQIIQSIVRVQTQVQASASGQQQSSP